MEGTTLNSVCTTAWCLSAVRYDRYNRTETIGVNMFTGMKRYNEVKDNTVLLTCKELEKQLSDKHSEIVVT
jgi:hypothetical protein